MDIALLKQTTKDLFANGKWILAMDESTPTIDKRFAANGISQNVEMQHHYRELIASTPGLNESIGGAILYDDTIRQKTSNGKPMVTVLKNAGIIPGIKVDMGAKALSGFPNEKVTEGLDGLRERLAKYKTMDARLVNYKTTLLGVKNNLLKPKKMKKEDKHRKKTLEGKPKADSPSEQKEKAGNQEFPGYPHYPASEDIYNQEKEVNLDPNDLSKTKKTPLAPLEGNIKRFNEDMTGEDLDVPGSEADEAKANSGSEDEENNYYSLGGDRHNDLEEDNG